MSDDQPHGPYQDYLPPDQRASTPEERAALLEVSRRNQLPPPPPRPGRGTVWLNWTPADEDGAEDVEWWASWQDEHRCADLHGPAEEVRAWARSRDAEQVLVHVDDDVVPLDDTSWERALAAARRPRPAPTRFVGTIATPADQSGPGWFGRPPA